MSVERPVVVGMTGASGAELGRAMVDRLLSISIPVVLTVSGAARVVWRQEVDESFGVTLERWSDMPGFSYHSAGDIQAPIASGTYPTLGMVIVPCSMATIAAVSHGLADNLVRRAADVCIKERRPLVVVPRESPLSVIHLDNMASLARLGVTVLPPEPAFYLRQSTVDDVIAFVVERVVVALGIEPKLPADMRYQGSTTDP